MVAFALQARQTGPALQDSSACRRSIWLAWRPCTGSHYHTPRPRGLARQLRCVAGILCSESTQRNLCGTSSGGLLMPFRSVPPQCSWKGRVSGTNWQRHAAECACRPFLQVLPNVMLACGFVSATGWPILARQFRLAFPRALRWGP